MLQTRKLPDRNDAVLVSYDPCETRIRKSGRAYFNKEVPLVKITGSEITVDASVAKEFCLSVVVTDEKNKTDFAEVVLWQ